MPAGIVLKKRNNLEDGIFKVSQVSGYQTYAGVDQFCFGFILKLFKFAYKLIRISH